MYKKLTVVALASMIGAVAFAQQNRECLKKGEQRGKCEMRDRKGSMDKGKHHGRDMMMKHVFGQLGLLKEQQSKIKVLTDEMKEVSKAGKESFKEYFEAQKALIEADSFDEDAYRANIRKAAQAKEDIEVKKAYIKRKIRDILTPTQKQKMEEVFAEMKEKREARKKKMEERKQKKMSEGK